jgi:hypothetical protein
MRMVRSKRKPGRDGPGTKREPRQFADRNAAPDTITEDGSSDLLDDTASPGDAGSAKRSWSPPAEFDFDGTLVDGCILESGDSIALPDGASVIDTGWHQTETFTIRAVFTAASQDLGQRDWMESVLLRRPANESETAQ